MKVAQSKRFTHRCGYDGVSSCESWEVRTILLLSLVSMTKIQGTYACALMPTTKCFTEFRGAMPTLCRHHCADIKGHHGAGGFQRAFQGAGAGRL